MRRIIITAILTAAAVCTAFGQNTPPPGYVLADSLIFTPLSSVDSTLEGSSIFNVLPANVSISQSGVIRSAVESRVRGNRSRMYNGYRIRIFFDNGQNARGASEAALYRFKVLNPGVAAYRSFSNPYFKVTVGDYRTKSDAMAALGPIKQQFPAAFIVRDRFKYPAMKNRSGFRIDTIKVLKKVQ